MKEGLNSISNLDEYDFSSITSLFPPELSDDIKHQLEFFLRQYRNTVFQFPWTTLCHCKNLLQSQILVELTKM